MDIKECLEVVKDTIQNNVADAYNLAGGQARQYVHTDLPRQDCRFPRVSVRKLRVDPSIISMGQENNTDWEKVILAITFYTKEGFKVSINSVSISNDLLVEYYISKIKDTLKAQQTYMKTNGLGGYKYLGSSEVVYNSETQLYFSELFIRVWWFNG